MRRRRCEGHTAKFLLGTLAYAQVRNWVRSALQAVCTARIRLSLTSRHRTREKYLTPIPVRHIVCNIYCVIHSNSEMSDLFENLRLELRRGCLVLAVLARSEEHTSELQ